MELTDVPTRDVAPRADELRPEPSALDAMGPERFAAGGVVERPEEPGEIAAS